MRKQICSCFEIIVESGELDDAGVALLRFFGVLLTEMGGGWQDSKLLRCSLCWICTTFLSNCKE
jgi:hypothetical protein